MNPTWNLVDMRKLLTLFLAFCWCNVFGQADTWSYRGDFPGSPRDQGIGFTINGKVYVGMGTDYFTGPASFGDLWEYDPTTGVWTQKASIPGSPRSGAVGFSIDQKGYVVGGYDVGPGTYLVDVWEYDPSLNTWIQKADLPFARKNAVGFAVGGKGYVGAGEQFGFELTNFFEYDPALDQWNPIADFPGFARQGMVGFSLGAKGYVGTGFRNPLSYSNEFWEFDPSLNQWTRKADVGGGGRTAAMGAGVYGRGYIGAGYDGGSSKMDLWSYNATTNTWLEKNNIPIQRGYPVSLAANGRILVATGNIFDNGFWEYNPGIPSITSFTPTTGLSGTLVTINGENFDWDPANIVVTFNGVPANIQSASPNSLEVIVPIGASSGLISVSVLGEENTSPSPFIVIHQPPRVYSISPIQGQAGSIVTIIGDNFDLQPAGNTVFFGTLRATVATASPTELTVEVPTGAPYGSISVVTHGMSAYSQKNFVLTFPAGAISYLPAVQHAVSGGPNFVSSADLDGDGALDLAVVTQFSNKVDILRNTSSGPSSVSFTTDGILPVFFPPTVAFGDVDGDGKMDAVVGDGSANTVSVFRNAATGTGLISFEGAINFPTDGNPLGVAIRDFDYDGRVDIAVTTQSNTVSVLRNTGTGIGIISFAPKVDFSTGNGPVSLQIADLDGDGSSDIVIANINSYSISVLRNTSGGPGSISFARFDYSTGSAPGSVAIGDFDNDGLHDIAVTNEGNGTASVFRNQGFPGSINFAARVNFTVGTSPKSVAIADLNGDSRPDMAITNSTSKSVSVFRNTSIAIGTVSFAPKVDLSVDSNPFGLSLADMDRDGKPDLVVTEPFSSTVAVLPNRVAPPQTVTTADSLALAALYLTTNGPGWTNKTNWLSGSVNTWYGVTVTAGRVEGLSLSGNNLNGPLPSNLGDLTDLTSLDLSANSISGSVPTSIGSLVMITQLNLSNNLLTGQLPSGIGNLNQLVSLRLNKNQLSGDIPSTVGSFVGLTIVALEENHFTSLPAFISTVITQLSVGSNNLTFEDLEPNIGKSVFTYTPQGEIPGLPPKQIYQIQTLTLGYALEGTANQYQWSKDGVIIPGATSNPFVKPNSLPSDGGAYTLEVTNTLVPGLVLSTGPTSVAIAPVATGFPFQPTNGPVNSMTIDPATGTLYFGGSFSLVNLPVTGPFVPVDKTSGLPQSGFPSINGEVRLIVPDGMGGYIVSGSFSMVGGQLRNNLAQVDGAGNVTAWNPNPNSYIRCAAVVGSTVYVAGFFTTIGGVPRQYLAAIDLATGAILGWNPGISEAFAIRSMAAGSGQLYVGGEFTGSFGGQTRNHAAALDLTTGALTSWNPNVGDEGIGGNRGVLCMHFDGTKVFLGGFFERVGGIGRVNVAAVDPSLGTLLGWNAGLFNDFIYTSVTAMTKVGNTLYLAGTFRQIVGQGRQGFAALDATSGALTAWNPGRVDTSNGAASLVESSGVIYSAGSTFFLAGISGNEYRGGIAAIDAATGLVTSWNPNPNAHVNALSVSGSSILMGGGFNTVGGMPRGSLAGLDIATGIINEWNPAPDGTINALAYDNGNVFVGGSFNTIGGQSRSKLAAVNAVTGLSTTWNPSPGPAGSQILSIAVAGNLVYTGGFFTSIGGQSRNRIAALDMSTGAATSWNPNSSHNVRSVSIGSNSIFAGGDFTTIGGQSRNFLAALDLVSGASSSWNPNPFGGVATVFVSCNTIYVGGTFFTSIGGQPRNRLAAIDAGTGLATSWDPNPTGGSTSILAIAKSGNVVYAGGNFLAMGGQTRNYVAAIDAETGSPIPWDPNANGVVRAILTHGDKVYVAGDFSTMAMPSGWTGMTSSFLTKLDGNAASVPTITSFNPAGGLPGTVVTIMGTNFDPVQLNNTVSINGVPATVVASTATSIDVLVPVGVSTGRIVITVACTSAMSATDFTAGSGIIVISPHPVSAAVCEGSTTIMAISASGTTNILYQWQKFDGTVYTNISDGGGFSGTSTTTLSINTTGSFGAGDYRCKVSGDFAPDVFSNVATLTVNPIPAPPTSPVDGNSCGPGAVTVSVSGAAPGEYRWYTTATGGTAIAGEQNASYTISPLAATTTYHAAINIASCESATRTPVVGTIHPVPALAGAVPNFHCGPGTVTISATGEVNGNYRWYAGAVGGLPLAGEVNSSFVTPSITTTTSFFVTLHNGNCESLSRTEVIASINANPSDPSTPSVLPECSGSTFTFSTSGASPGEYRWYTVPTGGTPIAGATSDFYSTILTTAANPTHYVSILINGCESGRLSATAIVIPLPLPPNPPNPALVCTGEPAVLTATGSVNGNYRWYDGTTLITGEVNNTYTTPALSSNRTFGVSIHDGTCESPAVTLVASVQTCSPPVVATQVSAPFVPGIIRIDLTPLLSDPENNLDITTLQIISGLPSGATATIDGTDLVIDYSGMPFPGIETIVIEVCDLTAKCTTETLTLNLSTEITVFNAISPNADGKNDVIFIENIDLLPETQQNKLTLFNRWGSVVFEAVNYNNTTNSFRGLGKNGEELPSGTYFYTLEFSSGAPKRTGFISLRK